MNLKIPKNLFLVLLLISIFLQVFLKDVFCQSGDAQILVPGETLIYKVKYLFLRVGTLKLINEGSVYFKNEKRTKLKLFVDSADGIPFVNIHDIYESYVDSNFVPAAFYAWEKKGDHTLFTAYEFDYRSDSVRVLIQEKYSDRVEVVEDKKLKIEGIFRDVLSLLYYTRKKSVEFGDNITIPTFVLGQPDSCYFDVIEPKDEIETVAGNLNSNYVKGKVKFIGIAGIKDDFEGWFSTDMQRIPLKAKMKAFFGSVTLQLEDYQNWQPELHN